LDEAESIWSQTDVIKNILLDIGGYFK